MNALQYVKNVGKSFGYSAIDAFKEYNPQVTELAKGAKELSSDLYDKIQDFKANISNTEAENNLIGKGKDAIQELRKNLLEDLKSGNWYNKQRTDKIENEAVAEMFGFDEDDFNLDDLDFDFNDDSDASDGDDTETLVEVQKESTESIIEALDVVGSKSSAAIATATVQSADYIASSSKQNTKALYGLNERGFHQMSTGLAAINSNISSLIALGEPLTTHMQNASTFYTSSTEFHKSVLEKLDEIIKLNTPDIDNSSTRKEGTLSSILMGGVLDLPSYFDMISKNVKNLYDDMMGYVDMVGGPDQLIKMITGSPLKFATDAITRGIVPKTLKNGMESFNTNLESFFAAAIDKLEHKSYGGTTGTIIDAIRDYIFPKSGYKESMDTSNYNKGKAIWNGKSEKALQEVLPTYLSKIYSAISGAPETRYDYDRGKYVAVSGIKKEFDEKLKRYAFNAGGDFRKDSLSVVENLGLTKEEQDKMKDQIDNFFLNMFKTGKAKIMDINEKGFEFQNYGLDEESYKVLKDVLNSYTKIRKTNIANEAASEMRMQRDRVGDDLRYMESQGDIASTLFNNSNIITEGTKDFKVKAGGILGTDKYNHDLFFYLQGIYQYTGHLSDNIGFIGSGKGGRSRNNIKNGGDPNPIRDIPKGVTEEEKEEASKNNTSTQNNSRSNYQTPYDTIYKRHKYEDGVEAKDPLSKTQRQEFDKKREKIQNDYNAGVISESEYNKQVEELNEEIRKKSEDGLLNRLRNRNNNKVKGEEQAKGVRKILEKVHSIFNKPSEVIADILSAGEISMYHFLYGKENDDEKGLFAYFFEKADQLFDKFDNFLQDKFSFSLKEWTKKMFGKAADSSFVKDVKEQMKNIGNAVKNDFSNATGFGSSDDNGEGETEPIDNGQAATGRKVTKTGIVAVSEGEMIIPSEYNPYYHGTNDKKTQLKNESNAIKKFFGNYAEGGTVGVDRQEYDPMTQEWILFDSDGNEIGRRQASARDVLKQKGRDISGNIKTTYTRKKFRRIHRDEKIEKSKDAKNLKDILSGSAAKLVNGIDDFIKGLIPEDKGKKENKIIDKIISEENKKRLKEANISEEAVKNRGSIGAGAIIGAGASVLTGLVVGPLAGATIGAGVGLVAKSEKVQKALFGDVDENGDRKGGILPKKISNFMTKQLPGIGKATGYGALAGALFGSPIIGAIVGGSIGFVRHSDKAKAALFGKQNKDGSWDEGFIKKELQDKIKKSIPNIGAGVLAGMIAGPFGIIGNIVVGGALGYATTTDKFKDMILGEVGEDGKRKGGLVGDIRTYFFGKKEDDEKQGVFTSLNNIFHELANEIKIHARNIFKDTSKTIRKIISRGAKSTFGQWLGRTFIGKAAKKVGGAAVGLAKLPFNAVRGGLQKIDEGLGRRALRKGYGMYNKDGKMMTAEERLKKREELGMDGRLVHGALSSDYKSYKNLDQYLAGASSDDLKMLRETFAQFEDPTKKFDNDELKAKKEFASMLDQYNIDPKTAYQLEKMAVGKGRKGNITDILSKVDGLDDEDITALTSKFSDITTAQEGRRNAKANKDAVRKQLMNGSKLWGKFGRLKGIDIKDDSDIRNMLDLIKTEEEARNNIPKEEIKEKQSEGREVENNENLNKITELTQNIFGILQEEKERIFGSLEDRKRVREAKNFDKLNSNIEDVYGRLGVTGTDGLTLNERHRRENLESKYGMSYDDLEKRRLEAEKQGLKLDFDNGKIIKDGYSVDMETGKASKYFEPEVQDVAAVSEGEIILDPQGGRRGLIRRGMDKANDWFMDDLRKAGSIAKTESTEFVKATGGLVKKIGGVTRRGYHRLVGMFANGGIVGEGSTNRTDIPESFMIDKANVYITGDSKKEWGDEENNSSTNTAKDIVNSSSLNIPNDSKNHGLADEKDSVVTQTDMFGNIYQMRRSEQGELVMDETDSQTQQAMDSQNKIKEALYTIPTLGASMAGVGGVLHTIKDGMFGNKEEGKEGFFSKLMEKFTGEDSFLGGIFRFITDSKIGTGVKSVLGRVNLGTIFSGIIVPALGLAAISGKLDGIGESLSANLKSLRGNDTKSTLKDNRIDTIDGQELAKDENGDYIRNENREFQTTNGDYVSGTIKKAGSDTSIGTQMKKNLITGIITGKGTVLGSTTAIGLNTAKKVFTGTKGNIKSTTLAKTVAETSSSIGANIMLNIQKLLEKLPTVLSKIPFIGRWVNQDSVSTICNTLYEHLDDAVKAAGPKLASIANAVSNALYVLKIITVIGAGIDAWGNAESILGITEDATVGQRVIAVLVAVTNALIPIIGNLIPNKVLVNIFMSIAPKIGIDVSSLEEQRKAAEAEVQEYNEANGTDYSIEEYNQVVQNKAGLFTKVKNKVSGFFTNVKEQGLGKAVSGLFGGGSGVEENEKKSDSVAGKFVSQISDKFKNKAFGKSTIGENGCAPAVATMVANAVKPGSISMDEAISEATEYESSNGTSADYFKSVLNKRGILSNYIDTNTEEGKESLVKDITDGKPTILLGKDILNNSKTKSPFGPKDHYVVANGIDSNGNVVINDPESKTSDKKYGINILDKVKLAISASKQESNNTEASTLQQSDFGGDLLGSITSAFSTGLSNALSGNFNNNTETVEQGSGSGIEIKNNQTTISNKQENRTIKTPVVDNTMVSLLKTLIKLVQNISDNTSSISTIGNTLTNYCNKKITNDVEDGSSSTNNSTKSDSKKSKIGRVDPNNDPALKDLMSTLSAIATG